MLERIAAFIVVTGIFSILTIIGLFLVFLSYDLLQGSAMASQMFGAGSGIAGLGLLAKIYYSLGRTGWSWAEFENERSRE